jgi:hypothetical protein
MKTITPVSIWHNGTVYSADTFRLYCIDNDLLDSAVFYYELKSGTVTTSQGNLAMEGADYLAMNSDSDSNSYAWTWAASQLGLTII